MSNTNTRSNVVKEQRCMESLVLKQENIPSLWQHLSWIWLICGIGFVLMSATTNWDDSAFEKPSSEKSHRYLGELQQVTYSAPTKSPTLVEVVIYNK